MRRADLENIFPCGPIEAEMTNAPAVVWGLQLLFAGIAVWSVYHGYTMYRNQRELFFFISYVDVFVFLYALWRMYRQDDVEIYIARHGLIVSRTPVLWKERLEKFFFPQAFYLYVSYSSIIGFTPDWKALYIHSKEGGIFLVPISLQFLSSFDKGRILKALVEKNGTVKDDYNS